MKTRLVLTAFLISFFFLIGCSTNDDNGQDPPENLDPIETLPGSIENFPFTWNGNATIGKIYLPESYETNHNLPTIYLIDFQDQHFEIATDEFEKVIAAVNQKTGFDALVVTLQQHLGIDAQPEGIETYYAMFEGMASSVDSEFTNNTSRTFIGRGSEAGIVMMTMFLEDSETSIFNNFIATDSPGNFNSEIVEFIDSGNFPQDKGNKKLHFSFSNSNNNSECNNMINKINEADFPWLQFESIHFNDIYINTYPEAFVAGINYIFN